MKNYFEKPTQVVFADPDTGDTWISGIAYRDEIICSCCGGVFEIDEVIEAAAEAGIVNAIYEYADWNDIASDIVGGELPEGLERNDDYEVVETAKVEGYEQYHFLLEEEEEVQATFANTWVDGVAMPSVE